MNEKVDGLLKSADPAKNLQLGEPGAFAPKNKKPLKSREWFALQGRRSQLATMAAAFALVLGLGISAVGFAPHDTKPIMTLGSGPQATAPNSDAAQSKMAAGGMMMPWFQYEYRAADNLNSESPTNIVYRLQLTGDPKQILSALGKQVGVSGQVQTFDEASYGPNNYFIGSSDWTKPTVTINWAGTGNWSYSDPTAYPDCQPQPSDSATTGWCTLPDGSTAKRNFPTEAVAAAQAARIFTAGGLKVTASDIKITKDDYSMSASASLEVAGQPTALTWQASWSTTGQLAYAYGQSVTVEKVSDVPTIDAKRAIERLSDWRWSGQAAESFYPTGPMVYGRMADDATGALVGTETSTSGGSADASTGSAVAPTEAATSPDQIVDPTEEPIPTPEVKLFLVNKASAALLLVYDAQGNAWLVPGYFLEGDQGVAGSVLAVADGVIQLPPADDAVMQMVK